MIIISNGKMVRIIFLFTREWRDSNHLMIENFKNKYRTFEQFIFPIFFRTHIQTECTPPYLARIAINIFLVLNFFLNLIP